MYACIKRSEDSGLDQLFSGSQPVNTSDEHESKILSWIFNVVYYKNKSINNILYIKISLAQTKLSSIPDDILRLHVTVRYLYHWLVNISHTTKV